VQMVSTFIRQPKTKTVNIEMKLRGRNAQNLNRNQQFNFQIKTKFLRTKHPNIQLETGNVNLETHVELSPQCSQRA